jgi:hypothetical protein
VVQSIVEAALAQPQSVDSRLVATVAARMLDKKVAFLWLAPASSTALTFALCACL